MLSAIIFFALNKETPMLRLRFCGLLVLASVLGGCSSGDDASCTPSEEVCNGRDDDCDGIADNNGSAALTRTCDANGVSGTQKCEVAKWSECQANCSPSPETCNGKDDDCNGKIDDGLDGSPLQVDCGTACGPGTAVCVNGTPTNCTAPQVQKEICDGIDNNCNGSVDEDFLCAVNETEPCGSDVGACEYGTRKCGPLCEWGSCTGGTVSKTEVCDGYNDEDCDGTVDNGCGCTDGTKKDCCGGTQITCAGGTWPACPTPPAETCNDLDDDCNGKVDDNLPVTPFMLEEDVTKQDKCDLAKMPPGGALFVSGTTFDGYIYKSDGAPDADWFKFTTQEPSGFCVPMSDQCVTTTFTLTEPAGKDYEFCVRFDTVSGTVSCTGGKKVCSTDAGQAKNKIVVKYDGVCGLEDGIDYYMEVKPVDATVFSCKPYKVGMTFTTVSGTCL
jgi:hypothetical protein